MKIAFVAEDPAIRGGIPGYAVPVADALVARGHSVRYLYSGSYSGSYDWRVRTRWKQTAQQSGRVDVALVNAKGMPFDGGAPTADHDGPDLPVFLERIAAEGPDVVHVHSFLGVPTGLVPALRKRGFRTVVSVHEFGLICQRRVLVRRDQSLCDSYASQVHCSDCVEPDPAGRYKLRARLAGTANGMPLKLLHKFEDATRRDLTVSPLRRGSDPARPVIADAAGSGPWADRLRANVQALESANTVLAVSNYVKRALVAAGVSGERVEVNYIGSASAESLSRLPLPSANGKATRFLFLGGLVPNKGAHVLLDAERLASLSSELVLAGPGDSDYGRRLLQNLPGHVTYVGPYDANQRQELLREADVVIAPAVGPDTSPQAVLEALAAGRPVIGSAIGGIPDFVQHDLNGLLVRPGDPVELAAAMARMQSPGEVARLAAAAKLPRTVDEHVSDLQSIYTRA